MLHDVECFATTRSTNKAVQSVRTKWMILMDWFDQRRVELVLIPSKHFLDVILNLRHNLTHLLIIKNITLKIHIFDGPRHWFIRMNIINHLNPTSQLMNSKP